VKIKKKMTFQKEIRYIEVISTDYFS